YSFGPSALVISNSVILDGSTAPGLSIERDLAAPEMRLIFIQTNVAVTLSNLNFSAGLAHGGPGQGGSAGGGGGAGMGGAIFNQGNLVLDGVSIHDCLALGGDGGPAIVGNISGG